MKNIKINNLLSDYFESPRYYDVAVSAVMEHLKKEKIKWLQEIKRYNNNSIHYNKNLDTYILGCIKRLKEK